MYISYDIKNGFEYAKLCVSKRDGKKVLKSYKNIGRVLDKARGIYQNRERGVFAYDPATDTYGKPPEDFVPDAGQAKERLILDFGDAFLVDSYMKRLGLYPAIDAVRYGNPDTPRAMVLYYILCGMSNSHAAEWWEGSFARMLFPKADLRSQRISDFLESAGGEPAMRRFFSEYCRLLGVKGIDTENILIDSTGLPNSIHFPLTAVSNHNGDIENEIRLVYIVQQGTGLPIYMRYCPGNIVDVSTITASVAELRAQGIDTKMAVLDAGYYSEANIDTFYENGISFMTRLKESLKVYREVVGRCRGKLESKENMVSYNGRLVYVKTVPCKLNGHGAYAYVCLDILRKNDEVDKLVKSAGCRKMSAAKVFDSMESKGMFVLVSSRRIAPKNVLPFYYTRQQIEQVFDIGKNYADMLPLRVRTEETLRGHLLLTFIATVVVKFLQNELLKTAITPKSLLLNMRNQKCKVFGETVIPQEANKNAAECYRLLGIKCPAAISLNK